MKILRKWFVEVFGFGQAESKGFIIFLGFALLLSFLSLSLPDFLFRKANHFEEDQKLLASLVRGIEIVDNSTKPDAAIFIQDFDPNQLDYFDWKKLGLEPILANRIISYRVKGGRFDNANDLLKIYGFSDSLYASLKPFVKIEVKKKHQAWKAYPKKKEFIAFTDNVNRSSKPVIIKPNINLCDSSDLLFIKGIGPSRAARIVKYRDALGGFSKLDQINEIYGLDSTVLHELMNNITYEENFELKTIDLNSVEFKVLLKHPYFDYNLTKVIINFRKQHGPYRNLDDLRKIKILESQWIEKVAPYLVFNPV